MSPPQELGFRADQVAAEEFTDSPDAPIYGVFFGTGDPEGDGLHWSFSRCFEDDDGVCTVREIQQVTIYDGIQSFAVDRQSVRCVFEPAVVPPTGFAELRITFDVEDEMWERLSHMLDVVFRDRSCYRRS